MSVSYPNDGEFRVACASTHSAEECAEFLRRDGHEVTKEYCLARARRLLASGAFSEETAPWAVPRKVVPVQEFVRVVLAADAAGKSLEDVARKLDVEDETVYQRLASLRRQGVDLPKLKRATTNGGTKKLDINQLNELVGVYRGNPVGWTD